MEQLIPALTIKCSHIIFRKISVKTSEAFVKHSRRERDFGSFIITAEKNLYVIINTFANQEVEIGSKTG